ncbi:MAG: ATP-grasp domain-containing protein [Candidatus Thiodiazotropha sp. (ex Ctena orbiculata)]|nr:ATP-grasp domain-containing protein [Candidatus Thiodiazotropha taylori]
MKVFVTDGYARAALAVTRSLGAKGHQVFVGSESERSLASSSKYCHLGISYPNPAEEPEAFVDFLIDRVEQFGIEVLMPVTDVCLLLVSKHRARFPSTCSLPIADDAAINAAADKNYILELAKSIGMPVPQSLVIDSIEGLEQGLSGAGLEYPVVLKPVRSRVKSASGWISTAVDYAADRDELLEKLEAYVPEVYPVILQQRISGVGSGAFYCFNNGRCIAKFAHSRLREKPPSGGVSVLRESRLIDPKVDEYSQKLLTALGWHGVAMVEFKIDEATGDAYIMEINGRYWGSLQLAIDAGVDFPEILLSMVSADDPKDPPEYKTGVKTRWFWGDMDLLLMYLLKKREALKLPEQHPGRLMAILSILLPWSRGQRFEILRLKDMGPWFYESKKWINTNLLNRLE